MWERYREKEMERRYTERKYDDGVERIERTMAANGGGVNRRVNADDDDDHDNNDSKNIAVQINKLTLFLIDFMRGGTYAIDWRKLNWIGLGTGHNRILAATTIVCYRICALSFITIFAQSEFRLYIFFLLSQWLTTNCLPKRTTILCHTPSILPIWRKWNECVLCWWWMGEWLLQMTIKHMCFLRSLFVHLAKWFHLATTMMTIV